MKKCPFCGEEKQLSEYGCQVCGSFLGDEETGLSPSANEKGLARLREKQNGTKRKVSKTTEYVRLYHGLRVKKSTAEWLGKKDEEASSWLFFLIVVGLIIGLAKGCS
jgi:hypothetical protein